MRHARDGVTGLVGPTPVAPARFCAPAADFGGRVGSRVELFEAIRRDHRRDDLSIRELSARYRVHRRTVRQALACPWPPPKKPRRLPAPKMDPVRALIDKMLREDLDAPRKQRHTARRVWTPWDQAVLAFDLDDSVGQDARRARDVDVG